MQEYTRIEPPMKITTAGNNVLCDTAQGIFLVIVRGTDDALRTVSLIAHSVGARTENKYIFEFGRRKERR